MKITNKQLKQFYTKSKIPGLAVCESKQGKKNFTIIGDTSQSTLYDIASLTKIVIATRILQLVETDKIRLNHKVIEYINNFGNADITIEDCLLHRTGFKASPSLRYTYKGNKLKETILDCIDLESGNTGVMNYSCINFILLGYVIESIDGPLEASLRKNIFLPMKMNTTQFGPIEFGDVAPTEVTSKRGTIKGEVHDQTSYALGGIAGNAGLFSTIEDLSLFCEGLLSNTLLREETMNLLIKTNISGRSLGWNRLGESQKLLYHTGFTGPVIVLDYENQSFLIMLTNRTYPTRDNQLYLVLREALLKEIYGS